MLSSGPWFGLENDALLYRMMMIILQSVSTANTDHGAKSTEYRQRRNNFTVLLMWRLMMTWLLR